MSRSPRSQRRFNDYRPLPPPSPQSKSERANAARFADELFLQEEVTATPNGSVPQVILHSRSPSKGNVSPRNTSSSQGGVGYASGVRLHSRAPSDERGHSTPRRLYHPEPLNSHYLMNAAPTGATVVPRETGDMARPSSASAPRRYASAPRTHDGAVASSRPLVVKDVHTTSSPPIRQRSRSHPQQPLRAGSRSGSGAGARQPLLEAPVSREVKRPRGYRSYTRETFNSRQQRTEKHDKDDDLLAAALQRPPWNPNTTPTHDRYPYHWAIGDEDHGDEDDHAATGGSPGAGSGPRRSLTQGRGDGEDATERATHRRRRTHSSPDGQTRPSEVARLPDRPGSLSPVGERPASRAHQRRSQSQQQQRARGAAGAGRATPYDIPDGREPMTPVRASPYRVREAQLLEEILGEVERLRVEAKELRRQLRDYRRREKSYILHIQALERVLQERVTGGENTTAAAAAAVAAPAAAPRSQRQQPRQIPVADLSADTTLQSLTLSPVPRTSAQPLLSTNVSANVLDWRQEDRAAAPPPPLPLPQQPQQLQQRPQQLRQDTKPSPSSEAHPAVDSLLAKLNDLKAIEQRLRGELRDAVSTTNTTNSHNRGAANDTERVDNSRPHPRTARDDRALHRDAARYDPPREPPQSQYHHDDAAALHRAALLAQYRPAAEPAPLSATTGRPVYVHGRRMPEALAADRYDEVDQGGVQRRRTSSTDYAVRIHHSHHTRSEQEPDIAYTLGIQGDPAYTAPVPDHVQRPRALEADEEDRHAPSTPPPPLYATVAAVRDDVLKAARDADVEEEEENSAEKARQARARERALLLQSLEVSPTKRNAHLHEVRQNIVAHPPPPHADLMGGHRIRSPHPHKVVQGSADVAVETGADDIHSLRAVSEYEVWRSFHDDDDDGDHGEAEF